MSLGDPRVRITEINESYFVQPVRDFQAAIAVAAPLLPVEEPQLMLQESEFIRNAGRPTPSSDPHMNVSLAYLASGGALWCIRPAHMDPSTGLFPNLYYAALGVPKKDAASTYYRGFRPGNVGAPFGTPQNPYPAFSTFSSGGTDSDFLMAFVGKSPNTTSNQTYVQIVPYMSPFSPFGIEWLYEGFNGVSGGRLELDEDEIVETFTNFVAQFGGTFYKVVSNTEKSITLKQLNGSIPNLEFQQGSVRLLRCGQGQASYSEVSPTTLHATPFPATNQIRAVGTPNWLTNQWVNWQVLFDYDNDGEDETLLVTANTATTITVTALDGSTVDVSASTDTTFKFRAPVNVVEITGTIPASGSQAYAPDATATYRAQGFSDGRVVFTEYSGLAALDDNALMGKVIAITTAGTPNVTTNYMIISHTNASDIVTMNVRSLVNGSVPDLSGYDTGIGGTSDPETVTVSRLDNDSLILGTLVTDVYPHGELTGWLAKYNGTMYRVSSNTAKTVTLRTLAGSGGSEPNFDASSGPLELFPARKVVLSAASLQGLAASASGDNINPRGYRVIHIGDGGNAVFHVVDAVDDSGDLALYLMKTDGTHNIEFTSLGSEDHWAIVEQGIPRTSFGDAQATAEAIEQLVGGRSNRAFMVRAWKGNPVKGGVLDETLVMSRFEEDTNSLGQSIGIDTAIRRSNHLRAILPETSPDEADPTTYLPQTTDSVTLRNGVPIIGNVRAFNLSGGTDGDAITATDVARALKTISNKEVYPSIRYIITGGHADWINTSTQYPVIALAAQDIATQRGDMLAGTVIPASVWLRSDYTEAALDYRRNTLAGLTSNRATSPYGPPIELSSPYTGKSFYFPIDAAVAVIIGRTNETDVLFRAPAGWRRAALLANKLSRVLTSNERGVLYNAGINTVKFDQNRGIAVWGQKTADRLPSKMNRINVILLLIQMRVDIEPFLETFQFEGNTATSRALLAAGIRSRMEVLQAQGGVDEFDVICTEANNPVQVRAENRFVVEVPVVPTDVGEYIDFIIPVRRGGGTVNLAR